MIVLGNPLSGATALPTCCRAAPPASASGCRPAPGASALRSITYFDGHTAGLHLGVLAAWIVLGAVAVVVGHHAPIQFAARSMTEAAKRPTDSAPAGAAVPADAAAPFDEDHPRHLDESDGAASGGRPARARRGGIPTGRVTGRTRHPAVPPTPTPTPFEEVTVALSDHDRIVLAALERELDPESTASSTGGADEHLYRRRARALARSAAAALAVILVVIGVGHGAVGVALAAAGYLAAVAALTSATAVPSGTATNGAVPRRGGGRTLLLMRRYAPGPDGAC